jgi:hypothetical protein
MSRQDRGQGNTYRSRPMRRRIRSFSARIGLGMLMPSLLFALVVAGLALLG